MVPLPTDREFESQTEQLNEKPKVCRSDSTGVRVLKSGLHLRKFLSGRSCGLHSEEETHYGTNFLVSNNTVWCCLENWC